MYIHIHPMALWLTDLQEEKAIYQEEVKSIKRQRSNASLQLENDELMSDIEVLQEENKNLKEMIRALEDANNPKNQDGGSNMNGYKNLQNIERNNNKLPGKTNFELLINEQSESTSLWSVIYERIRMRVYPWVCSKCNTWNHKNRANNHLGTQRAQHIDSVVKIMGATLHYQILHRTIHLEDRTCDVWSLQHYPSIWSFSLQLPSQKSLIVHRSRYSPVHWNIAQPC